MKKQKPNFEQAINASIIWCNGWDNEELSDEVLAERVGELIKSIEGARGFFATSLSSDSPLMDRLPEPLVFRLREAGEMIVDLTVKNLAMSSSMAVAHERNNDLDQQLRSKRVTERCIELLRLLDTRSVKKRLEDMLKGTKGKGSDKDFIIRWEYDNAQIIAIQENINKVAEK